jgi:hypothetical protein
MKNPILCFSLHRSMFFRLLPGAVSLFLGGGIYLLFKPSEPVFFHWLKSLGLYDMVTGIRSCSLSIFPHPATWLIYELPDALWAFAYAWAITVIWSDHGSWIKYLWMLTIPCIVLGSELLQYSGMIPGTFSFTDLICETSGIVAGVALSILYLKPSCYEKKYLIT